MMAETPQAAPNPTMAFTISEMISDNVIRRLIRKKEELMNLVREKKRKSGKIPYSLDFSIWKIGFQLNVPCNPSPFISP